MPRSSGQENRSTNMTSTPRARRGCARLANRCSAPPPRPSVSMMQTTVVFFLLTYCQPPRRPRRPMSFFALDEPQRALSVICTSICGPKHSRPDDDLPSPDQRQSRTCHDKPACEASWKLARRALCAQAGYRDTRCQQFQQHSIPGAPNGLPYADPYAQRRRSAGRAERIIESFIALRLFRPSSYFRPAGAD